jgi:hypothetical protein
MIGFNYRFHPFYVRARAHTRLRQKVRTRVELAGRDARSIFGLCEWKECSVPLVRSIDELCSPTSSPTKRGS